MGYGQFHAGNGVAAGNSNLLYFTAGPNEESHGLFGVLTPVPEASTYAMMLAGLGLLGLLTRRRALGLETELEKREMAGTAGLPA